MTSIEFKNAVYLLPDPKLLSTQQKNPSNVNVLSSKKYALSNYKMISVSKQKCDELPVTSEWVVSPTEMKLLRNNGRSAT